MSFRTLAKTSNLPTLFSDFFEPWNDWFPDAIMNKITTMPKVNITEEKDGFALSVAAPGLHKSDFKIDVDGNMLTVSAKKEENTEEKKENFTRQEYNYSSFSRTFNLPEGVQKDKIAATYDGGVLKLNLPKSEKAIKEAPTSIPVN